MNKINTFITYILNNKKYLPPVLLQVVFFSCLFLKIHTSFCELIFTLCFALLGLSIATYSFYALQNLYKLSQKEHSFSHFFGSKKKQVSKKHALNLTVSRNSLFTSFSMGLLIFLFTEDLRRVFFQSEDFSWFHQQPLELGVVFSSEQIFTFKYFLAQFLTLFALKLLHKNLNNFQDIHRNLQQHRNHYIYGLFSSFYTYSQTQMQIHSISLCFLTFILSVSTPSVYLRHGDINFFFLFTLIYLLSLCAPGFLIRRPLIFFLSGLCLYALSTIFDPIGHSLLWTNLMVAQKLGNFSFHYTLPTWSPEYLFILVSTAMISPTLNLVVYSLKLSYSLPLFLLGHLAALLFIKTSTGEFLISLHIPQILYIIFFLYHNDISSFLFSPGFIHENRNVDPKKWLFKLMSIPFSLWIIYFMLLKIQFVFILMSFFCFFKTVSLALMLTYRTFLSSSLEGSFGKTQYHLNK